MFILQITATVLSLIAFLWSVAELASHRDVRSLGTTLFTATVLISSGTAFGNGWHQPHPAFTCVLAVWALIWVVGNRHVANSVAPEESSDTIYRSLLEHLPQMIFRKDLEGRFTFANREFCRLHGISEQEIIGKTAFDLNPPELAEKYTRDDQHVLTTLQTMEIVEVHSVNDGDLIFVKVVKMPIFDADQQIVGVQAIFWDVTQEKNAERERLAQLDRARQQHAALVQLATSASVNEGDPSVAFQELTTTAANVLEVERVGIWLFSDEGHELNCVSLFERTANRHSSGLRLHADDYPSYFAAMKTGRAVDAHDARQDERTSEFRDGYLVPFNITSMLDAPIRVSGVLTGAVCHEHVGPARQWTNDELAFAAAIADQVALVLTTVKRHNAEQEALEAQRHLLELKQTEKDRIESELERTRAELVEKTRLATIGEFSAQLAHDVRNCTGPINNYAHFLERQLPRNEANESLHDAIEEIHKEVYLCDRIIAELIEYARLTEPNRETTELESLARSAAGSLQFPSEIRLSFQFEPSPFTALVDPAQFHRVFDNLLRNSSEAISEQGEIRIFGSQSNGEMIIVIEDTGSGVAVADRETIFQPFVTTKSKGSGLGLASCRYIVEHHGGKISLQPSRDVGTAIEIRLPMESNGI